MSTIRPEIIALLSEGEYGAKNISKIVRISEKEVYEHLEHIGRVVKSKKRNVRIIPARCLECGFVFEMSTTILNIFSPAWRKAEARYSRSWAFRISSVP
jgi:predicted Zn-ribbon and HTH transcriptional regulator